MQNGIRGNLLRALKASGVFDRVRDSRWRQSRLLILCYHSLALDDENQWRPGEFLLAARLRERFETLKQGGYRVLDLAEALERLRRDDLPPRSVALTFDDGTYDFRKLTYPLLKEYGFPATVYQTTYYCSRGMPVFPLICYYMLWKKRDAVVPAAASIGITQDISLATAEGREMAIRHLLEFAGREQLSTEQKNDLAAELGRHLGIDYAELLRRRIVQLMTPEEIAGLAGDSIRFELHTHRHRTPRDRALFDREIRDNREALEAMTRIRPVHFCYPSGDYDLMFLPWLAEQGVISATTCEAGLACRKSRPLLLERFIDTSGQSELDFESWLTGVRGLLASGVKAASLQGFRS
ncbi:MAG: polysaccharide deacetylase family protein [Candidatus Sulfotelmatobacter sp.]